MNLSGCKTISKHMCASMSHQHWHSSVSYVEFKGTNYTCNIIQVKSSHSTLNITFTGKIKHPCTCNPCSPQQWPALLQKVFFQRFQSSLCLQVRGLYKGMETMVGSSPIGGGLYFSTLISRRRMSSRWSGHS